MVLRIERRDDMEVIKRIKRERTAERQEDKREAEEQCEKGLL